MTKILGTDAAVNRVCRFLLIPFLPFLLAACATNADGESYAYHPAAGTYFKVPVRTGDTVSEIAYRYHVDEEDVVAMNKLRDRDEIVPGGNLMIPAYGRWRDNTAHHATPYSDRRVASNNVVPRPVARPQESATPRPAPKPVAQNTNTTPAVMPRTDAKFLWPVNGRVLQSYGSQPGGEHNDGINISASAGASVRASAAGTVTYVGNELKGYGNLVLIRHDNGYVTAYAHNERLAVGRGDRVERGQIIAYAGATGDVNTPQVHFEIRRGTHPVDPKPFMVMASN